MLKENELTHITPATTMHRGLKAVKNTGPYVFINPPWMDVARQS